MSGSLSYTNNHYPSIKDIHISIKSCPYHYLKYLAITATFLLCLLPSLAVASNNEESSNAQPLVWSCDPEGTPPYPYYNPYNTQEIIGFEVDIIEAIAQQLGRKPILKKHDWDTIIPGLNRGLYDVIINGMVVTEEKEESVLFSKPYYITSAQLITRQDNSTIHSLDDCTHKVLGIFKSAEILQIVKNYPDIEIRNYENEINAFNDLSNGRLDAVLIDSIAAVYALGMNPKLKMVGSPIGKLEYAIILKKDDEELLKSINTAIHNLIQSGALRKILESWNIWNPLTAEYFNDFSPASTAAPTKYRETIESFSKKTITPKKRLQRYLSFLPILAESAWITLKISILAMLLATIAGFILALARVYGPWPIRMLVSSFIELIRGTPLLIQLLFIYYGLANIGLNLSPFIAGVLGLGINYTAFEAENYRAGILSVHKGQLEAARALGMTHLQGLRHVVIPQAFTTVIPPITNDFISLLKDSSLVSAITIVELTKTYTTLAFTYYDFFGIGILVAFIYLLIGLPFVRFARWAEKRLDTTQKKYKKIKNT